MALQSIGQMSADNLPRIYGILSAYNKGMDELRRGYRFIWRQGHPSRWLLSDRMHAIGGRLNDEMSSDLKAAFGAITDIEAGDALSPVSTTTEAEFGSFGSRQWVLEANAEELNKLHHIKIPKVMEHVKALRSSITTVIALSAVCLCNMAFASPKESCFTTRDLQTLQRNFFTHFPDANAFERYVDKSQFELRTNAPEGRQLEDGGSPTAKKIDWVIRTMNTHKDLFSGFEFDKPDFTYMRGQLRGGKPSVKNLRTSKRFPKDECVQEVNYDIPSGACVMSQRLNRLSITFVKDERPLSLSSVEMFFIACTAK
ncbi:hypothetical protein LMG22037_03350 [Paraburkholderia phenoliruptrix]|uniref:Uncharacterized protein n=1 Tax=Paraburkholderia phenoliruptrix TaxID=252970 RepID=A0A6J5BAM2_9BURK|nr:hypothetical protein [Paraburkholderia phenoliruptrix]CAB3698088.1 hypothetical protein LMG22037_03350 [Paraburkholderia phenoliruptrix]